MSPNRILVGADGSLNSFIALEVAMAEARGRNLPVRVITAYNTAKFVPDAMVPEQEPKVRAAATDILDEAVGYAAEHGTKAESELVRGDATSALIERSDDAALVVVGARGKGGFAGRLLGSVATGLPGRAACPVVVVPQDERVKWPKTDMDYRGHVVVGIDSLGAQNPALEQAALVAESRDQPLFIVAAASVTFGGFETSASPHESAAIHARIRPALDACVEAVRKAHPKVTVGSWIHDGLPSNVLIDASVTATMVVVGSRGRGGFRGMLLGSTAEKLLQYSSGPVMVVRS